MPNETSVKKRKYRETNKAKIAAKQREYYQANKAARDAELIRMRANGSEWWAIAEEVERSENWCRKRYAELTTEARHAAQ